MVDLKLKGHDFEPIAADGTTKCRQCSIAVTGAFLMWGGPSLAECEPLLAPTAVGDICECGAFKALGLGRDTPGHSPWCPWSMK